METPEVSPMATHPTGFIPALAFPDLISLNSSFFLISQWTYRQMSFAYLDNKMLRNFAHLKERPIYSEKSTRAAWFFEANT